MKHCRAMRDDAGGLGSGADRPVSRAGGETWVRLVVASVQGGSAPRLSTPGGRIRGRDGSAGTMLHGIMFAVIVLIGCGPSPAGDARDVATEVADAVSRDVANARADTGPKDASTEDPRDANGTDALEIDVVDAAAAVDAVDAAVGDVAADRAVAIDAGPPGGRGAPCRARIPACAPGYPGTLCDTGLVCVDDVCVAGLPSGAPCGGGAVGRCAEEAACLDDGPDTVVPTCRPRGTFGSECIFTALRSCDLGGSTDFVCADGLICSPTTFRCGR